MNKIIFLLFMGLFCGMNAMNVRAQLTAAAQASANILDPSKAAQVKYINNFAQTVPNNSASGKSIVLLSENGKLVTSNLQSLASFSITSENKSAFSVSLPSHPIYLKNSRNNNTLQVDGWHSSAQPGNSDMQKNIWVVNLGASLKMGSVSSNLEGVYSGTYLITFVYN